MQREGRVIDMQDRGEGWTVVFYMSIDRMKIKQNGCCCNFYSVENKQDSKSENIDLWGNYFANKHRSEWKEIVFNYIINI